MTDTTSNSMTKFLGTKSDDILAEGFESFDGNSLLGQQNIVASVNGLEGDDTLTTSLGNDLVAGDMVGAEWSLVDGEWIYDAAAVELSAYGFADSFNDVITTGQGNDVLLGNGGHDLLIAGGGNDTVNAGRDDDRVFAGTGNDLVNLEQGHDYVEAGLGADVVNGGAGNDVIYGDLAGDNLLTNGDQNAPTFNALAQGGAWAMTDDQGTTQITQSAATVAGETYTISFDLAANLSAGRSTASVDVIWNGEVIDTVKAVTGAFETFEVDVISTGNDGELSFRAVPVADETPYNFDGPIISYAKKVTIDGAEVTVNAFAAGQSNLYQVIEGQLNVFDVASEQYTEVSAGPDFKINAVGFNIEDNLIYGVAKSAGHDSLGAPVTSSDIVMIDASGDTFRIGEGFYGDFVGDFDSNGNLWTFESTLNRISVVDVDNLDADGNPQIDYYKFPTNMFTDRTYDLAFDAAQNSFLAVVAPTQNGGNGKVVRIDISDVTSGGEPTFTELEITGTLQGDTMLDGMARGAFGAVFFDGEGNLYYGLNNGDHDLDQSTGAQGGIFRVDMDWAAGSAYAEFMAEAPATGSNDGAVDPRSADAFAQIDADAAVLLRDPALTLVEGGNDTLRGGEGNDEIYGNGGDDDINGGHGDDLLSGDQGNDKISSGQGSDVLKGGVGNDSLRGQEDNDMLAGDAGNDFLDGGTGQDILSGGEGTDKIVGGAGEDEIIGGAGNDQLWGGNWSADGDTDTFVFEAASGRDFIHDFEVDHDVIDISAFETNLSELFASSQDQGWATLIDLKSLDAGQANDQIVLLNVSLADLDASSFIL